MGGFCVRNTQYVAAPVPGHRMIRTHR
jgi:hypothetical protein